MSRAALLLALMLGGCGGDSRWEGKVYADASKIPAGGVAIETFASAEECGRTGTAALQRLPHGDGRTICSRKGAQPAPRLGDMVCRPDGRGRAVCRPAGEV